MEFRILGPLEVCDGGEPVAIAGGRQRALLALLLLRPNEVVSNDTLIDELWHGEPTETARKAIQVHVSGLRKALGEDRIVTQAPGYRLRVDPGELDLERFEALRADDGVEGLREALALWRGPPLDDFAYEPFAQAERARLEELKLVTIEQRVEGDLALGRHPDLVPELERLVADEPLRERLRAQLMLALYRCGRQADALETYQAGRRALVEELGIDPGRALQELERDILRQEPRLDWTPPQEQSVAPTPPPQAPVPAGIFVGRQRELEQCREALDRALSGAGGLVLISGEPGIGKSRLADELTGRAAGLGATALVGRCWEAGGAPPYWPWAQALRSYVRRSDARSLREQLGAGAADVANVAPDIRNALTDLPEPDSFDSDGARFRVFDSVVSFLERASSIRPLLIVLDDLHAADAPSLLLLQFVAAALERMHVLIVGAYRSLDPTVSEQLAATLSGLARHETTRRVALGGLSEGEVREFVELSGIDAPVTVGAKLHASTEGNPLFVSELVRLLAEEGRLEEAGPRIVVPDTVREVIGRRLRHLSSECRRVLTLASILGREFGLVALERVADYTGIDKLLEVLDEAIEARVVAEVPGAIGRLRFSHALIRDTLYGELPATQRVRLHKRVADVLDELYAADREPHLAELAHHHLAAVPAVDLAVAVDYARRAGDRAAALLAYEEAARLYGLALDALAEEGTPDDAARCDLLLALGDVQARAGDMPDAKRSFLEAAELARRRAMPERQALAALGYGGRFVWHRAGTDSRLVPLLEDALDDLGDRDDALRSRLLSRLAGALRGEPGPESRLALSLEAVELARRTSDPATLAYALDGSYSAIAVRDTEHWLALGAEIVDLAQRSGDRERAFHGHLHCLGASMELGDIERVDVELASMRRIAEELRQPAQRWMVRVNEVARTMFDGQIGRADALVEGSLELGEGSAAYNAETVFRIQLFALRREQGRLAEIEPLVRRSVEEFPARPLFRCLLVQLCAEEGRSEEALELLEALAADGFAAIPSDNEWLYSLGALSEACGALGAVGPAASLYEVLAPYAEFNVYNYPEVSVGSAGRLVGVLAGVLGRPDEAARHFEAALESNGRMGARPWVAHTHDQYARMLLAHGDQERAAEHRAAAIRLFRELELEHWAEKAADPGATPTGARPSSPEQLARAALGYAGRIVWGRAGDDSQLVPLLEEALAALGDSDLGLRSRLLARLAGALRDEHSRERRDALSLEAVDLARRSGDPSVLVYALDGRASAIQGPDALEETLAVAGELCELAEETGDAEGLVAGYDHRVWVLVQLGDIPAAESDLDAAKRVADRLKQPARLWTVHSQRTMLALAAGRLDEAEALNAETLAFGKRSNPAAAIPGYRLEEYALCDFRGGLDELEPGIRELAAGYPARPIFRCLLAHFLARLDRLPEAQRELDELAVDAFSVLPFDQEWLYATSLLAEAYAVVGDESATVELYGLLEPWAALNAADPGEGMRGSVARYLGLLATALGRFDEAEPHFEAGLAMNERMGARPWLAHTQFDYARMLLAREAAGDHERALSLAESALATYRELGMAPWIERAEALQAS